MATRTVAVKLVADVGAYQSSVVQAAATTRTLGTTATQTGNQARRGFETAGRAASLLAGIVGGALVIGLKSAVDAAAQAEQSVGAVDAVFKSYSDSVKQSAREADTALGLSANSYRELATVIGSQMKNAGVPLERLAQQTDDIIGIGADLAAQFGGSTQQAVEALSSAFRGELDPIERYGISLTAAAVGAKAVELGLATSATQLSQNAKAQATLALITEQSADAQGAFARETGTASNRAQVAAAQWQNLKVQVGDQLLPVWTSLVSVLSDDVIPAVSGVVDAVAGVVRFISDLPAPVLVGAAALGTMALVTGPLAGAFTTLAAQVSFATGVMGASGGVMAATRAAASGLLATLGGPLGLAVAGAAAGLTLLVQWLNSSDEATEDATRAADEYTTALKDSNGAITDSVRAAAAKAAQDAGLLDVANDLGIAEGDVTRAITDQGAALDRTREQLEEFIAAHTTERENNYGFTTTQIDDQGRAAQEALTSLNLLAETTTNTASSEAQLAAETSGATGALDEGTEAADSYSDQLSEAKKAVDELVASLAILTGSNNSLLSAENAVGAAIDAATGALDEQGGTVLDVNGNLNSYSENGRAASDVLLDLANSSNELIATMIQQGSSVADVTARDAELRASFIQTANQMGITGADAERLADQIYGIPAERSTRITADTSQADQAVRDFVARVSGTTVVMSGDFTARPGVVVRKADGGAIYGPGTGTSDSIPAMLSNGEYVVRASSVSKYGVAALDAINSGSMSDLRYYAGGGLVAEDGSRVRAGFYDNLGPGIVRAEDGSLVRSSFYNGVGNAAIAVALRGLENIRLEAAPSSAGPAGGGAIGGGWQTIWNIVKGAIPQARINSTFRPGDPGYHGRGKAIDFGFGSGPGGAGSAGLASIARFLYNGYGSTLAELIYDGIGDDTPDVKNGRSHTYNAATRAQHANHVHAAVYDQGGLLPSGTAAVNLSGSPELVLNPAQTAAAMRSREFSGTSTSFGAQPVVVEIAGAEITGTLQMGGDGLMRIVDGRIVQAVTTLDRTLSGRK